MKFIALVQRHYSVFLCICIILLGVYLRFFNYQSVPRLGATFDEFAWTWLGINLIQKNVPESWSPHSQYTNRQHVEYMGAKFFIVKPYLEHPPLFGIVAGGFALLRGAKGMFDVNLQKIRPLGLIISAYTLFVFFLFTWKIFSTRVTLFSMIIFATMPTAVIGSRIIQNENFMIGLWLTALLFIHWYIVTKKERFLWVAAIISGIATTAKVPWLIIGISLAAILSFNNQWKPAFKLLGITCLIFLLFVIYGFVIDFNLFLKLWTLQLARYDIHFHGLYSLFTQPLLVDRWYIDGWVYFGWFAFFLTLVNIKKYYWIIIPCVSYLILFVFAIPDEPMHGWYRYPFLPFLSMSIAIFLDSELKNMTFQRLVLFFIVGLSLLGLTWETVYGFSFIIYRGYIIFSCLIVFVPLWFKKFNKYANPALFLWFVCMIGLNAWAVMRYNDN